MFCRACWANIPDGSVTCSKCQADLRAAPAPQPPRQATPPERATSRAGNRGTSNRLIVLLVIMFGLVVGAQPAMNWYEEYRARQEPAEPAGQPGTAETAGGALAGAPPQVEPGAGGETDSLEARLSREAFTLYRQGQIEEACRRYDEVVFRAGSDGARRNLGSCLARLGRDAVQANQPRLAVEYYQRALQAYPNALRVWLGLAHAQARAGDLAGAEASLERATWSFPNDPEVLYLLAEVRERRGRTREAVDALRQLLQVQPAHARGKALLASLQREQQFEGSYWSQESRHFVVRYEGAKGIDLGRSVVDTLESAYDSIGRDLGLFPQDRIQVGIYSTEVLGEVIGFPAHYVAGAYDGKKIRLNIAESRAYSNSLSRLVRHEYAHAVIHLATNGRAPIWLHEGLAQVMEPRAAPRFVEVSLPREFLTLSGIERLARSGSLEGVAAGYALVHVAVAHMIERGGVSSMRDFLARLGRGEPIPGAMRASFGFGPEEVERRLLAVGGRS